MRASRPAAASHRTEGAVAGRWFRALSVVFPLSRSPSVHLGGDNSLPSLRNVNLLLILDDDVLLAAAFQLLEHEATGLVAVEEAGSAIGQPDDIHELELSESSHRHPVNSDEQVHASVVDRRHLVAEHLLNRVLGLDGS